MGWTGCFPRGDSLQDYPASTGEAAHGHHLDSRLASIGIDIGKEVFHIVGFGADGKIAFRRKIKRLALDRDLQKLPPSVVGMEACLSAHFVSRALRQLGHEPRIIPAIYVKPFVKGQKNDYNDAEAIAEAALRPEPAHRAGEDAGSARPSGLPSRALPPGLAPNGDDQPDPRLPHRARHCGQDGSRALRNSLFAILKNREDEISPRMSDLIVGLYEDWLWLDERIETITGEIEEISQREANCSRLMSVPGVGPLISTAVVAAIGTGEAFDRGRDFGAWLGLCPANTAPVADRSWAASPSEEATISNPVHPGRKRHPDATAKLGELQLRRMAAERSITDAPQQAGHRPRQQAGADRLERPAQREGIRHPPSRGHGDLSRTSPSSRLRNCMERIDKRTLSLVTQMVARQPVR